MKLSPATYTELIKFARGLIKGQPHFFVNEYDLVHYVLGCSLSDARRAMVDRFDSEKKYYKAIRKGLGGSDRQSEKEADGPIQIPKDSPWEKICSSCQFSLPIEFFRETVETATGNYLLETRCLICERQALDPVYRKNRGSAVFREAMAVRARETWMKLLFPSTADGSTAERLKMLRRRCCGCELPLPPRFFYLRYRKSEERFFLSSKCKWCERRRQRIFYEQVKESGVFKSKVKETGKQLWRKMVQDKPVLDAHNRNRRRRYGERMDTEPMFKEKNRAAGKKYYAKNKEKEKLRSRKKYLKKKARMATDPAYKEKVRKRKRENEKIRLAKMPEEKRLALEEKERVRKREQMRRKRAAMTLAQRQAADRKRNQRKKKAR